MIPTPAIFDQSLLALLLTHDPVVQRYRRFFSLFDWSVVLPRSADRAWPGPQPHPQTAYIKVLLVKLCEGYPSITQLRRNLVEHPLLVLDLGFLPVLDVPAGAPKLCIFQSLARANGFSDRDGGGGREAGRGGFNPWLGLMAFPTAMVAAAERPVVVVSIPTSG